LHIEYHQHVLDVVVVVEVVPTVDVSVCVSMVVVSMVVVPGVPVLGIAVLVEIIPVVVPEE
jgi:hypothetical protein